jgi:hypothetical protein
VLSLLSFERLPSHRVRCQKSGLQLQSLSALPARFLAAAIARHRHLDQRQSGGGARGLLIGQVVRRRGAAALRSYTPVPSPAPHSFAQDALQRLSMAVGSGGRAGDVERRGGAPLLRGCLHSSLAAPEGEVSAFLQHHTVGGAPCLARSPTATYLCVAVLERVSD